MSDHALIGRRIRQERAAAGYTQAQLAADAGVDATVLSRIENGQRGIDSVVLRRVARTLDVPMDRFFTEPAAVVLARGEDSEELRSMLAWARQMKADIEFVRTHAAGLDR